MELPGGEIDLSRWMAAGKCEPNVDGSSFLDDQHTGCAELITGQGHSEGKRANCYQHNSTSSLSRPTVREDTDRTKYRLLPNMNRD